jgi:hypothetical protein
MRLASFLPLVRASPDEDDRVVARLLLLRPIDRGEFDALATRLGRCWELPPEERAPLLDGLPELINALNREIDDGYTGEAHADDGPALLLRQFAHARRRLR